LSLTKTEIKYLTSLHNKKQRLREKRFLVEGTRLLEEALSAGYLPLTVFCCPSEIDSRGEKLIDGFRQVRVETKTVSSRECKLLTSTVSSPGIVALFPIRESNLSWQLREKPQRVLVCDKVGDPGNLGTLIRSAAAFRFGLVITTGGSAEVTNPKVIRASMGGFFRVPVVVDVPETETANLLKQSKYSLYQADIKGSDVGTAMPITGRIALIVGSETAGSGKILGGQADYRIRIPISDKVESLNAAVAGSILMFWFGSKEEAKK